MHQKTTLSAGVRQQMSIARWLFNPFVRVGGEQALVIGLGAIVVSGLAAGAAGVHFSALLNFRSGFGAPFWVPVVEGLMNWSVISLILVVVSLFAAPHTVRLVDVVGTQALARVPLLLAALVAGLPRVRQSNRELIELASAVLEGERFTPTPGSVFVGLTAGLFVTACVVWMVQLMWKAFAVSCNQRGGRAVVIFVVAVIAGHLATSFLWSEMFGSLVTAGLPSGS